MSRAALADVVLRDGRAEPPQGTLPTGRWAATLQAEFLAACLRIDTEGEELGEAGEILWYPDRTWWGRTYVPATARNTTCSICFWAGGVMPRASEGSSLACSPVARPRWNAGSSR